MRKENTWRDARVAAEYDARRFRAPLQRWKHRRDVRLVLALLAPSRRDRQGGEAARPRRVLDVPCGTERFRAALERAGMRVVGADRSLEMMRAGSVVAGSVAAPRVQGSAFHLPFRDGAFDDALSIRFLFHLDDREERVAVLRELRRVSRGRVVGQVRYRANWKHLGRWLRSRIGLSKRYRPSQSFADVAAELRSAGLELVELRPISRLFSDKALFVGRPIPRE